MHTASAALTTAAAEHALSHAAPHVLRYLREGDDLARFFGKQKIEDMEHHQLDQEHISCDACNTSIGNAHIRCLSCDADEDADESRISELCALCAMKANDLNCTKCRRRMAPTRLHEDASIRALRFARLACLGGPTDSIWKVTAARLIAALHSGGTSAMWVKAAEIALSLADEKGIPAPLIIDDARDLVPGTREFVMRMAQFMLAWRRRIPVVVRRCNIDRTRWMPERLCKEFSEKIEAAKAAGGGDETPTVERRGGEEHMSMSCDELFRAVFPTSYGVVTKVDLVGLRDWPKAITFADMMPEMCADFFRATPLSQLCHPEGRLNMTSRMPPETVALPTDMGPKVYAASADMITWAHNDMSDATNLMLHVDGDNDDDVGADWHVWSHLDRTLLVDALKRLYLQEHPDAPIDEPYNPLWPSDVKCFASEEELATMQAEGGVAPWKIEQRRGDAVFVPCGCPHQVRNLRGCFKIAVDFVSPECFDQMQVSAEELRDIRQKEIVQSELLALSAALSCMEDLGVHTRP